MPQFDVIKGGITKPRPPENTELVVVPVAADLCYEGGKVVVGSETARVCDAALQVVRTSPISEIRTPTYLLPAGFSPKYNVVMGEGPMRDYLLGKFTRKERFIESRAAAEFNTDGEMVEVAKYVKEFLRDSTLKMQLVIVVRRFHAKRTRAYLLEHLSRLQSNRLYKLDSRLTLEFVTVQSWDVVATVLELGKWWRDRKRIWPRK